MNSTSTAPKSPRYSKTSLDPLTDVVRRGMIAMGIVGLISTISTLCLLAFVTYRMVYWRRYYEQPMTKNQVLMLIYNLLIADLQQSISFVISFYWLSQNKLVGPHPMCTLQGWFIQIGDVSSGLWVLSIGLHTFINLVLRKTVPTKLFILWAVGIWVFCILISAAGPIKIKDIFVPTAAWCWIDPQYRWERLYLHYVFIFVAEIGSIAVYGFIVIFLHGQLTIHARNDIAFKSVASGQPNPKKGDTFAVSRRRILLTARYMVFYPATYVALTLPLAATRLAAMAGRKPRAPHYIFAGVMMTSCGWIDVLLYFTTRKVLVSTKIPIKSGPSPWHTFHTWASGLMPRKGGGLRTNRVTN